jgi:hypothetical protein
MAEEWQRRRGLAGAVRLAAALGLGLVAAVPAGAAPGGTSFRAAAVRPEPGLMWNRSGRPAVFPLLVKSAAGRDHYLLLTAADGQEVLAAYVRGGVFFRVLVPNGDFILHFASGPGGWRGEPALFGPGTRWLVLPAPLRFEVSGIGRKAGHIVDLRGRSTGAEVLAAVREQAICQALRLDPETLRLEPEPATDIATLVLTPGLPPPQHFGAPAYHLHSRICD